MRGIRRLGGAVVGAAAAAALVGSATAGGGDAFTVRRATMTLIPGDGPARLDVRGRIPGSLALDPFELGSAGFRIEVGNEVLVDSRQGGPWSILRSEGRRRDRWILADGEDSRTAATRLTFDLRTGRFRLESRNVDPGSAVDPEGASGIRLDLGGTLLERDFSFLDRSNRRFRYRNVDLRWQWLILTDPERIYLWEPGVPIDVATLVLENRMEWQAFWHGRGAPPEVDFANHRVAVISAVFPSSDYGLAIDGWSVVDGTLVVRVVESVPPGPCRIHDTGMGVERYAVIPRVTGAPLVSGGTAIRFEGRLEAVDCPERRGFIFD